MPGSWPPQEFPNATGENCIVTSPASRKYNCIAWAAGNETRWWWPDQLHIGYWPPGAPREETLDAFVRAYATLGYIECAGGELEPGYEKIAIYATNDRSGAADPTHAARQLPDGRWTSKIGQFEGIEHATLDALNSRGYGTAIRFLRRALAGAA